MRVAVLNQAQHTYGNRAVQRALNREATAFHAQTPRPTTMDAEGKTGDQPLHGVPVAEAAQGANLEPGEVNEWGELKGTLKSDVQPHLFRNQGKTGAARWHHAGGTGGVGNQGVGEIALTPPDYRGANPAAPGGTARAWIRPGTGKATVTRSYTGVTPGNSGTHYITTRAAARMGRHEVLHINSSRGFHNTHISPLETRVVQHTGQSNALSSGATQAAAITALQTFINWNTTNNNFRTADTAANQPGGTVDTADIATPDFYADYGPRTVRGRNYQHYIDIPPGP